MVFTRSIGALEVSCTRDTTHGSESHPVHSGERFLSLVSLLPRDLRRETLANLSTVGQLRCFSDQPVVEIVQCGEPNGNGTGYAAPRAIAGLTGASRASQGALAASSG